MVIILSHQGGSFVEKFVDVFNKNSINFCVIASKTDNNRVVLLEKTVNNVFFIEKDEINVTDLKKFIKTHNNEFKFSCVVSVWEGYRELMAYGNKLLNAFDISPSLAKKLRDKLYVRNRILSAGLSSIKYERLSTKNIERRLSDNCKSFIKPKSGLGSVGTKILSGVNDLSYIEKLETSVLKNKLLKSAITTNEFIVEDYIYGAEHSVEVIVCNNVVSILACHYKQPNYTRKTVTEPFAVSPSTKMDGLYSELNQWVQDILHTLNIDRGCYHIEFKLTQNRVFELIELNPRVGGALIIESTEYISRHNMIFLWTQTLLHKNINLPLTISEQSQKSINSSAFRVYFSNTIGVVKNIQYSDISIKPFLCNVLVSTGSELVFDKSEQFLAQALWIKQAANMSEVKKFHKRTLEDSKKYLNFNIYNNCSSKIFLIVDYNLSRVKEVKNIANIVYQNYGYKTTLVTSKGKGVFDDNIVSLEYDSVTNGSLVKDVVKSLEKSGHVPVSGLVFSDDAIVTGSKLLECYNLITDSSLGAEKSYDKLLYRESEKIQKLNIYIGVPEFYNLEKSKDCNKLFTKINQGFIVKPRKQGNNRGISSVYSVAELENSLNENIYLNDKHIAEQLIDIENEFSVDGVGKLRFITKKLSIRGRFPIEIGQVLPPNIDNAIENRILSANSMANSIVEQNIGAFHNEIMICSKNKNAYVVEPNRRPGGMGIWELIKKVYGIDLYREWILSSFGYSKLKNYKNKPKYSSGYLMLEGPIGHSVNLDVLLDNLEFIVDSVYLNLGLKLQNSPEYTFSSFIAPKNYIFKSPPENGHEFLISLIFTHHKDGDLESIMYSFYEFWSLNIKDILKKLLALH